MVLGYFQKPIKSQISLQMNDGFKSLSRIQCDPIDGTGQTPHKMPRNIWAMPKSAETFHWHRTHKLQHEAFTGRYSLCMQFSRDPAKTQRLLKKSSQNQNDSKWFQIEVPMTGEFWTEIYHSQSTDSIADPVKSEDFNFSWKFFTHYR